MTLTLSRRALLACGTGLALTTAAALAQTDPVAIDPKSLWSRDYRAVKGTTNLALYRRRLRAPVRDQTPAPILFLVHGSSISALPTFDLAVPGHGEYSVMNVFASYGFDVWAMDHENYGRSDRTSANSNIASGAEDLAAAWALIARETGATKMHLFGESSGALRAALFAAQHPAKVDRLVLAAYTYTGEGSPTLTKRAQDTEYYRTHNTRQRNRAMIESIFTRDRAGTSEPALADAIAAAELPFGEQVPTGTYLDMTANLPIVDPQKLSGPVMLIRGEFDGIATMADLLAFYAKLPSGDRQFVVLPATAHSVVWGKNRQLFWHAMRGFLDAPRYTSV